MSRISRDIYTSLDVNGPYLRIDTQPTSTITEHNKNGTFTLAASIYYLTGDEAEIGDIDVLEADAVAPTDTGLDNQTPGVPHTAKDQGYISYQWYEISVDPDDQSETVNKLTNGTLYSGVTTNTLTVNNTLSPSYHLNRYYCDLDYIPTTVGGEFDTGNAVNDIVTSDTVTLNVRPFIIINTEPVSVTTRINENDGSVFTRASLSDTRFPWNDYRLQFQWWEKDKLNEGSVPNIRLTDGDFTDTFTRYGVEEILVNNIQKTTETISVSGLNNETEIVGIPTETVEVSVKIIGASGGSGGDEDATSLGGSGGSGRVGEFKFSSAEIDYINNAGSPTEYIIASGSGGNGGRMGDGTRSGGLGGFGHTEETINPPGNSISGGSGGDSGPGGESGSGGGGGAASGILKVTDFGGTEYAEWIAVAGGGGGAGGASKEAPGNDGNDAGGWEEFEPRPFTISETKQATAVNYNPIAGTEQASFNQDRIEYGFYVKTSTETNSLNASTTYDRIVVVWDNQRVVNLFGSEAKLSSDTSGLYVQSGNMKYYASTHRGSLLGWCDNDDQNTICIKDDGGYTNSFDVFKQTNLADSSLSAYNGGTGADKIIGDGGGGGGGGGGSHSPTLGGDVGRDPIPSEEISLTFRVFSNVSYSILSGKYIRFIENSWYGFPETEPARGKVVTVDRVNLGASTFTVKLKPNTTYDVVSDLEEGRTSESLRLLQDLTATGNQNENDIIFGRSIGMNADGDDGTEEDDFRDFIVTVSDGTFEYSPQTVKLETEEIVGRAIIKFTTPASVTNSVKSTGGEGGRSEYNTQILDLIPSGDYGFNGSLHGRVDLTYKTEQPYNTIDEIIKSTPVTAKYSVRGSSALEPSGYTSTLTIKSNYVLGKRVLCQITAWNISTDSVALTSGPDTVYTNTADITFSDDRDNTIVVEQIRYNDDFAILSNVNLNNGDLTFERSTLAGQKEVAYYSFYSNEDIEVDVKMYGGKGSDLGSFSGGEGGFSYLRLNMEADTEYVIAGLDNFVNTPFLFKRSRLLACVGGGGDANTLGAGAPGGGVTINGGNAPRGGIGGIAPTTLSEDGVFGSASIGMALPIDVSGDTQASIPNGGTTVRCSKGTPIPGGPSPCTNRSGNTKFKTSNLADVVNTKEVSRGFKAGYNVLYTAGRNNGAIINQGWGGSGATGGGGSDEYGGGGGSGYIIPGLTTDIFARSEEQSSQDGTDPITSTLGGSTGSAKVVISLAEIPSATLPGFIERPAEPNVNITNVDVFRVPDFEPLPELTTPPLADPPVPSMDITSMESTGFASGTKTFTPPYSHNKINVLEKGQLNVNVKTQNIPPGVTYYWKVIRVNGNDTYTDADFGDDITGSFTTSKVGEEVVGSFTINPPEDNQTDFIGGDQKWTFNIYSDREYVYVISNSTTFKLLDTSLSAPVATFSGLLPDQITGVRILNSIDESSSQTIDVATENIKNNDTIYWKLLNSSGSPITATTTPSTSDFVGGTVSGTATVESGYKLDADGAAFNISSELSTANLGTASFVISAKEDVITEGLESFGLQIEYPSGTVITRTTGTIVGEVKKSIKINDISIDPEASFSGDSSVNEGNKLDVTVHTAYLKTGDTVFWKLFKSDGSTNADAADFVDGITTGSFSVTETSGSTAPRRTATGSLTIEPKNDSTTEGTESFKLKVYRDSNHTEALHITNTTNDAFFDFNVIDTSLSAKIYESIVPETMDEDGLNKKVTFKVKNLFRETTIGQVRGPTYYWRIYEHDSDGVHALGIPKLDEDGDIIEGEYIKDFTAYQGNFKVAYTGDETGSVPVHEKEFNIVPEPDLLDEGSKDYEIRFFDSKSEFDKTGDNGTPVHTSSKFTVEDTSVTQYLLNTSYGYGVPSDEDKSGGGNSAFNQPTVYTSDAPAINEESLHSFRLETTAQPGTLLYYDFFDDTTDDDDWDSFRERDLPRSRSSGNNEGYAISENYNTFSTLSGEIRTMPIADTGLTQLTNARSVAFIYILPEADRSPRPGDRNNEGPETFELVVYNEDADEVLIQSGIKLLDSSIVDEPPKITMFLEGKNATATNGFTKTEGGGVNDDEVVYQIYSETTLVRIAWTLSGGAATDGQITGDWTKRNSNAEPNSDEWWLPSTSNKGEYFKAPKNTDANNPDYYDYEMEISNEDGNQTSTYTLTLKVVPAPVSYRPTLLFRYFRVNNIEPGSSEKFKVYRYVTTAFGPSDAVRAAYEPLASTNVNAYIAYQEDWGRKMAAEMTRIHGASISNPATGTNPGSVAWRLEGGTAFAFSEDNRPSGTYSMRDIFQGYYGYRDYMPWPNQDSMYYLWADNEIDSNVPSNAIGLRPVYAQKSTQFKSNRTDYRIVSDGDQRQAECNDPAFVSCYESYISSSTGIYKYREASYSTVSWTE